MDKSDPAYHGQKDYTPRLLANYDSFVLGFMANRVWRSPIPPAVDRYRRCIGRRHLDVGPGTGYFLDEAAPEGTEITLLDPNENVLAHASERLARFEPATVRADVLKPLPVDGPFDSAAMSFVLHCLPGPMERKARAIENVAAVLETDGVLFGGTLLGMGADHTWAGRQVLRVGNWKRGFDNLTDTPDALEEILDASFEDTHVEVVHSVGYFEARRPRR